MQGYFPSANDQISIAFAGDASGRLQLVGTPRYRAAEGIVDVPDLDFDLDTVVLLPHLGSGTVETRDAMERLTLDNLDSFLRDGTVLTPVPEVCS